MSTYDSKNNRTKFLAHVKEEKDGTFVLHYLDEHLEGTAKLASQYAAVFGNSDWAKVAAVWHDLGKYQQAFQRAIKFHSGYDPNAHLEGPVGRVDHSTVSLAHVDALYRVPAAL